MSATTIETVSRSVEKTNVWLKDMAEQLGTDDRHEAYRALRSVMHTLRDRLTVEETAQLAAQLPLLVRGIYYDGWKPSATPRKYHDAEEFLDRVAAEGSFHGETEASFAVAAAARVLRHHVSAGELDDVLHVLPAPVRALFSE